MVYSYNEAISGSRLGALGHRCRVCQAAELDHQSHTHAPQLPRLSRFQGNLKGDPWKRASEFRKPQGGLGSPGRDPIYGALLGFTKGCLDGIQPEFWFLGYPRSSHVLHGPGNQLGATSLLCLNKRLLCSRVACHFWGYLAFQGYACIGDLRLETQVLKVARTFPRNARTIPEPPFPIIHMCGLCSSPPS